MIKACNVLTDVQWLLYLQDHSCYCMLFDTYRCDPFQIFSGYYLQDHGCNMVWEDSPVVVLCNQQNLKKNITMSLQLVCNQGNHSVIKVTGYCLLIHIHKK